MVSKFQSGTKLFAAFGRDAIEVQKTLDKAYSSELNNSRALLLELSQAIGDLALDLHPRRLKVENMGIEHRARLQLSREEGFHIRLMPLNLGYDLKYGTTATSECKLTVRIQQIKISKNRGAPAQHDKTN